MFDREGYDGARVADIVREAGMSSRSFYELFDSKADLVAEVVRTLGQGLVEHLDEIFAETEDLGERIDRGLRAYLDIFRVAHVDLEHLGGEAGVVVRDVRRATVRDIAARMTEALRGAHARGEVARAPDPVRVELLFTGIEGLSIRYYSEGRRDELRALHPLLVELVSEGLLGRGPEPTS